jgi:DNA mismatch endonuclease (patch repair protein)
MRANVRAGTSPERTMGRLLRKAGFQPAVDAKGSGIRYRADFLLRRAKIAIFVDGCFWHGCPRHWTKSKTRSGYWLEKRRANRLRDARANKAYVDAGWVVYRIWEHDAELFGSLVGEVAVSVRANSQ